TCAVCDKLLIGRIIDGKPGYLCVKDATRNSCGRLKIMGGPLEELVTEMILVRLEETPNVNRYLHSERDTGTEERAIIATLDNDERKLEELAQMWGTDQITGLEWTAARKPVEARIEANRVRLAALQSVRPSPVKDLRNLRQRWDKLNIDDQHAIAELLF